MDLVIKVVDTFKPSKLIVTFYATRVNTYFLIKSYLVSNIKLMITRIQKLLSFMRK